jgi:hypothetical protein
MLVYLNSKDDVQLKKNRWGWCLPWEEHKFLGYNTGVDKIMRKKLLCELE